jgi:polysaccharide export outer membrane protein
VRDQVGAGAETPGREPTKFASRSPRYRIEPGDVIELFFRFTPEYNQVVTVQPDGFIPLQAGGEMKVSGLTVNEAREAILERYTKTLHEPVVTLILKEFSKPFFVVGGEVARPGRFDLRGDVTMSDAIAIAGGFNLGAKTSEVLLFRRVSREMAEVKRVNLREILEKGMLAEDMVLQPGDSVYVPRSKVGRVERFMNISKLGLYFNPIPWRF